VHQLFSVAGFDVLTAAVIKISIFWYVTSCCLLKINRHVGGTDSDCYLLHAGFSLGVILIFDPEHEGDMFLKNLNFLQRTTRRYSLESRTLQLILLGKPIHLSMALQTFVGPWPLFSVS
jgi:hypothetical protein